MQSFLKSKSISSGFAQTLNTFCIKNNLQSTINQNYTVNDRISLELWLKKLKATDQQYTKEAIGLEIAKLLNLKDMGIYTYMAMACQNLYEYLDISLIYSRILYDHIDKKVTYEPNQIIIFWEKSQYYDIGLYSREIEISEELQVALHYKLFLTLIKTSTPIFHKVDLAIPTPKSTKEYEQYFQCPINFNTNKTAIYIKREIFKLPIKTSDSKLLTLLKFQADAQLNAMPINISFIELVNINIIKAIENHDPRIEIVAEYLNISTRTLQKLLKNEGVKYQELLNTARFYLAKQYLLDTTQLSIITISNLLGYKEQTSFNRVFKSWTGKSPLQWRETQMSSDNL